MKRFQPGDRVRVLVGQHAGKHGVVAFHSDGGYPVCVNIYGAISIAAYRTDEIESLMGQVDPIGPDPTNGEAVETFDAKTARLERAVLDAVADWHDGHIDDSERALDAQAALKSHLASAPESDAAMLERLGDNAQLWAQELMKRYSDLPADREDAEAIMIGWFANAIEHSHALRLRRMRDSEPMFEPVEPTDDDLAAIWLAELDHIPSPGALPMPAWLKKFGRECIARFGRHVPRVIDDSYLGLMFVAAKNGLDRDDWVCHVRAMLGANEKL